MARLPVISGIRFVRVMERIGYVWDHTEGSHMILVHRERQRLSVPNHRERQRLSVPNHRELGRGLLRGLIRDAGLTREEFFRLLAR